MRRDTYDLNRIAEDAVRRTLHPGMEPSAWSGLRRMRRSCGIDDYSDHIAAVKRGLEDLLKVQAQRDQLTLPATDGGD